MRGKSTNKLHVFFKSQVGLNFIYFFIFLFLISCSALKKKKKLCPEIQFQDTKINFNESENKLLCGDDTLEEWQEIPPKQVEYHLKSFLLERGYFDPDIKEKDNRIIVKVGPRTSVQKIEIKGWPDKSQSPSEKLFIGENLSPKKLSEMEKKILQELKSQGYACAKVKSQAYPFESRVVFNVEAGPVFYIPPIQRDQSPDFQILSLNRFEAFHEGDLYDFRKFELSERRIRNSGIVQDNVYLPMCDNQKLEINQKVFLGASRSVVIGAGFDTEQYAIAKLRLHFNRLTTKGSDLNTEIFASFKEQSFDNSLRYFPWEAQNRNHLFYDLSLLRQNEKQFKNIQVLNHLGWASQFDTLNNNWSFKIGPQFQREWNYRGVGDHNIFIYALQANISLKSHDFEYYQSAPQKGFLLQFDIKGTDDGFGSSFSGINSKISGQYLWRLWQDAKTDVILGFRGFLGTLFHTDEAFSKSKVPSSYRFFLGGSQNLRGFSRFELPKNGLGAFSAAYLGTELRISRMLPMEPIFFLDAGALSEESFNWSPPYYLSPGFGLRYHSFLGTLRFTAAYGYTLNEAPPKTKNSVQLFFSLGEEF
jgi:outer membrane protein assembly factor BamA